MNPPLEIVDLGCVAYPAALDRQRQTLEGVVAGGPNTLLLLEHDPVITLSQRRESAQHLIASPQRLAELGIDVQPTDRGGDITYHGPGQLVAYPILRLDDFGLSLSRYMRMLERVVIDAIEEFGVEGTTMEGATGVWVEGALGDNRAKPQVEDPPGRAAKIGALGVRIRKGVTMHGLALNVTTDLSHFDTIVPCGLVGSAVTSLQEILGSAAAPPMDIVKRTLARALETHLEAQSITAPPRGR